MDGCRLGVSDRIFGLQLEGGAFCHPILNVPIFAAAVAQPVYPVQ